MGWQLHGTHAHSHGGSNAAGVGHGHSHAENINVRAAFIHVLGDVLQSIGVFCAAIIIYFKPSWQLADPICTFIFSIIVLWTTITIMKDAVLVSICFARNAGSMYLGYRAAFCFLGFLIFIFILKTFQTMAQTNHTHTHTAISPNIYIHSYDVQLMS